MFIFLLIFVAFCSLYYYLSYQVILLNDLDQIFSQTAEKAQQDLKQYSDLLLEDLGKCYINILLLILLATAISFVWILLLKYNAKVIIWLSIFSLPILMSVGLYYSIVNYINLKEGNEDNELLPAEQTLEFEKALQTILTAELISYVRNETLWLVVSIILFIILTSSVIILHSLRERVSLSIALIRQASKAINGIKSTLIFPIIPRTIGIFVLVFGVLVSLLIISASHPTYHIVGGHDHGLACHPKLFRANRSTSATIPQNKLNTLQLNRNPQVVRFNQPTVNTNRPPTTFRNYTNDAQAQNLKPQCVAQQTLSRQHVWKYHALNLFATLWLIHFISGISQTTLAGAFASYYWAEGKPRHVPFFAVTRSFGRVIKNHLGDIALGSFLMATIRYIRLVIEFIDRRIRRTNSPEINNTTTRSTACFFRIFFWLLDRFLKYIDRNAYIMMSMYGEGYLQSAKRAIKLLYKNSTRALVLDYVTYFVLLISRVLITGLAVYITAQEMFTANLHYKWLPIVLVGVGTYFISKGLFSVYSMAVNTLFICFLLDSTNNDGSAERPYFMSKDLRRIMKRNTVIP